MEDQRKLSGLLCNELESFCGDTYRGRGSGECGSIGNFGEGW